MKKICVDQNKCIGCGACVAINPENFDFNEEGLSEVKNENPIDKTIEAEEACPVFAITIEHTNCECMEEKECNCDENCECGDNCTCGDDCKCDDEHCCCHDCECNDDIEEADEETEDEAA